MKLYFLRRFYRNNNHNNRNPVLIILIFVLAFLNFCKSSEGEESDRNLNSGFSFTTDWFEFLIPLKLLQWRDFQIIVGNYSESHSVKNSSWNWKWRIMEDETFLSMKEFYKADIEMAEIYKLVSSTSIETRNLSDENYSTSSHNFIFFLEPSEFLFESSTSFSTQSWVFLSKSDEINKTLDEWMTVLEKFVTFDSDIYIGIFDPLLFKYDVYELYRICESCPVQVVPYCTIFSTNVFEGRTCDWDKYQRRDNLQGLKIKGIGLNANPFDVDVKKTTTGQYEVFGGMFGEVFNILTSDANLTYEPVILEGYKFGKFDPVNRTWDGIMGAVSRAEVDMSINPVSMAADRLDYVDFSLAIQSVAVRIYIRSAFEEKSINWTFYTSPFSPLLHLAVASCSLLLALAMWLILEARPNKDEAFTLYETSWIIFAALCQKSSHMIPSSPSAKLSFLLAYAACLTIYCGYSATLTSQLSVPQPLKLPFHDMRGLIRTGRKWSAGPIKGDFTYIFMQKTCPEIIAKATNNDSTLQCQLLTQTYTKKVLPVESTLPTNAAEGLQKVLNEKFAFVTTETGARYIMSTKMKESDACNIYELKGQPLSSNLAFAMRTKMTYKKLIDYKLLHIFQTGTLARIRVHWYPKLKSCNKAADQGVTVATIYDVGTAPFVVFIGIIISFTLLIVELILARTKLQKATREQSDTSYNYHNNYSNTYYQHHY